MQDNDPVTIVGVGARTPLGLNAPSCSAAVRAAIGAIREHPYFVDKAGEPMFVSMDALLPADLGGADRFAELARPTLAEALEPIAKLENFSPSLPLFLGLPQRRPGLPENLEGGLAERLRRAGKTAPKSIAFFSAGHSAGLMALEQACAQLRSGHSYFCLAGGVDSYLEGETLEWLDEGRQLMSGENRSGFVPGEGAACCLLTLASNANRHGLNILASVAASHTAIEESLIKTDTICIGKGLTAAIAKTTASLSPPEKVDFTYCDLNGERYRSDEFTFALLRTQAAFIDASDNLTPADCWGDMGAASGPLFAVLAVASGQRGYAKGPRQLLWTSSEGGHRSAALLRLPIYAN